MVPAGIQHGLSVMSGKYFAMPLNILPNLLSGPAVTEESGALPGYWAAHCENSLLKIINWMGFPSLIQPFKEPSSNSPCIFAIQRIFFLPSSSFNEAYLRPGREMGNLSQPTCHRRISLRFLAPVLRGPGRSPAPAVPTLPLWSQEHTARLLPLSF